jgi:hypothetical protein
MATEKDKDTAAQSLAHKRWRGVGAEERSRLMSHAAKIRTAKLTPKRRREIARNAAHAHWADLTPEERSVEMKRRAQVRERNRSVKAKASKKRKPKSLNSDAEEATQAFLRAVKKDVDAAR